MPDDRDKGAFTTDIPADAIAEALAAVERRAATPAGPAEVAVAPPEPDEPRAPHGELERLREELALSQEEGRRTYAQLREEHDRRLRAAADLENFKKRAARERDEVLLFGVERLVKELLPALDNLERAIAAFPKDDPVAKGVEMTGRMLEDALGRFGAKPFSAKGQAFDPRLHEALMSVATAEHPPHTVIDQQQRGWMLHERLLRPAAVVVSAAPAGTKDAPPRAAAAEGEPGDEGS